MAEKNDNETEPEAAMRAVQLSKRSGLGSHLGDKDLATRFKRKPGGVDVRVRAWKLKDVPADITEEDIVKACTDGGLTEVLITRRLKGRKPRRGEREFYCRWIITGSHQEGFDVQQIEIENEIYWICALTMKRRILREGGQAQERSVDYRIADAKDKEKKEKEKAEEKPKT